MRVTYFTTGAHPGARPGGGSARPVAPTVPAPFFLLLGIASADLQTGVADRPGEWLAMMRCMRALASSFARRAAIL
jgi:hypothetical protein